MEIFGQFLEVNVACSSHGNDGQRVDVLPVKDGERWIKMGFYECQRVEPLEPQPPAGRWIKRACSPADLAHSRDIIGLLDFDHKAD